MSAVLHSYLGRPWKTPSSIFMALIRGANGERALHFLSQTNERNASPLYIELSARPDPPSPIQKIYWLCAQITSPNDPVAPLKPGEREPPKPHFGGINHHTVWQKVFQLKNVEFAVFAHCSVKKFWRFEPTNWSLTSPDSVCKVLSQACQPKSSFYPLLEL